MALDLADKIIQAVNGSREQINKLEFASLRILIRDGKTVRLKVEYDVDLTKGEEVV